MRRRGSSIGIWRHREARARSGRASCFGDPDEAVNVSVRPARQHGDEDWFRVHPPVNTDRTTPFCHRVSAYAVPPPLPPGTGRPPRGAPPPSGDADEDRDVVGGFIGNDPVEPDRIAGPDNEEMRFACVPALDGDRVGWSNEASRARSGDKIDLMTSIVRRNRQRATPAVGGASRTLGNTRVYKRHVDMPSRPDFVTGHAGGCHGARKWQERASPQHARKACRDFRHWFLAVRKQRADRTGTRPRPYSRRPSISIASKRSGSTRRSSQSSSSDRARELLLPEPLSTR